jgi:hypothetical protein
MNFPARFQILCIGALIAAPAFADPANPVVYECKVERRIETGKTTMYDEPTRAKAAMRFDFVADVKGNRGCLLAAGSKDTCDILFTGADDNGGMVRLDRMDAAKKLDLVNIFPLSGRFIRIHGDTQWMGKQGDCVLAKGRKVKLP